MIRCNIILSLLCLVLVGSGCNRNPDGSKDGGTLSESSQSSQETRKSSNPKDFFLVVSDGGAFNQLIVMDQAKSLMQMQYLIEAPRNGVKMTADKGTDMNKKLSPMGIPMSQLRPKAVAYLVHKDYLDTQERMRKYYSISAYILETGEIWVQSKSWDPHSYWYLQPTVRFTPSLLKMK